MLARGFGFSMWRLTLSHGFLFLLSAEWSVIMCGAGPGTLVTWPWLRLSVIYRSAVSLWSQINVTCRSCWFPDSIWLNSQIRLVPRFGLWSELQPLTCCAAARCLTPEGWLHTNEMVMEHFVNPNLSVVVAKCWLLGFVVWDITFMCSVFTATLT